MKMKSLIIALFTVACSTTAFAQWPYYGLCNSDTIQDLPKLQAGQPYNVLIRPSGYIDTLIQYPLPLSLDFRLTSDLTIFGLPSGFVVTKSYVEVPNNSYPVDSIITCVQISAPVSAVNAAIAASPNNDGVYSLNVILGDAFIKNHDPQSPLLAQYTWSSSITLDSLSFPIMLGQNTGGSDCYGLTFNGSNTNYAGLPATAGSFIISAENNYVNCPAPTTVSTSCNWLTASLQVTGSGTADITINYTANPLDTPRYCDVTIGNTIYHISQLEPDCNVAMNIDSTVVGPLEGTMYIWFEAADSCYWSILNRDFCDWVDINPKNGYGSDTIEISYAANNTGQARSCDIEISNATLHFEQDAATGIKENSATGFSIYPNPANDVLTVALPSLSGKEVLNIYNIAGQLLQQTLLTSNNQQISTAGLANGIYVLTLTDTNGIVLHKKVVISR